MKAKKIVLATLLALAVLTPVMQVQGRGWWEYYSHSRTIGQGNGIYHQHKHEGALTGYCDVVSATGDYSMSDNWSAPYLQVWITNDDSHSIDVTWRCYFYVN